MVEKNPVLRLMQEAAGVQRFAGSTATVAYLAAIGVKLPTILATGKLAQADALMERFRWKCIFQGRPLRLDGVQFGLMREIFGRQVYTGDPRLQIGPGDTVVDLGANTGVFSVAAAVAATSGRVIAVEAQGAYAEIIRHNAETNSVGNRVVVHHAVVGPDTGWFARTHAIHGSHYTTPPRTLTMPELLAENHLDQIDFLKVDIEGSEFALFGEDLDAWLPRVRRIAMEVHGDSGKPDDLRDLLVRSGYTTWSDRDESFLYGVR